MNGRIMQRLGIARRLVISIFLFSSFVTLIITGVQIFIEYKKEMVGIEKQMALVESSYLPSLVNSLWEMNSDQVGIILNGILSLPGMESVKIVQDGESGPSAGVLKSRHIIAKEFPLDIQLKYKQVHMGVLQVVSSVDAVYQTLFSRATSILIGNGITIFIVSGFIFLLIQFFIVRHLVEIDRFTQSIDLDNLEDNPGFGKSLSNPEQPDEIDRIYISINQMQDRIVKDLNKRKQTEETLRQFECIVSNSHDMMALLDTHYRYIEANDAFLRAFGKSREEIIGHKVSDIFGEEYFQDIIYPNAKKCMNGEIVRYSGWFNFSAAGYLHIDIEYSPYLDSSRKIMGFTVNARDITERKLAETALQESEEKFRSLFENSVVGIGIATVAGRFLEINDALLKMIGYKREALSKIKIATLYEKPEERESLIREIQDQGYIEGVECRLIHKEKGPFWVNISARAIRYKGEDAIQASILDVTEKKRMENMLIQSHKMEAIGTLAGGIAHDFNNILASIIGFTELSLNDADKPEELKDNLQEILAAGIRAKDLVRQILTFARQTEKESKPVHVQDVMQETLNLLRSSLPASIEIEARIRSESRIMADPTQLQQVIMNLCTNAAHAMEAAGGILDVSLNDVAVDHDAATAKVGLLPGDYVEIKVSDTGIGIPPSILRSIFEPYFTTKGLGEGTGMGLAVVHGIVEGNDGRIIVDSQLGIGTTFKVCWPITGERDQKQAGRNEKLPKGSERILFVDDEASIAKIGRLVLGRLGYAVTTKTSSIEALELFRDAPDDFDLVISDMTMPKMTGDQLAAKLISIRPDIPIILCTGYSKKISEATAAEIGIKALLTKPLVQADLSKSVRKVLDASKQKNEGFPA